MKKQISGSQPEQQTYAPPAIVHRGALKQFAGSPLGDGDQGGSNGILDLPGQ